MSHPRLFISYSWSNPQHEQWVEDLAAELVSIGIDVVFDKWELREGHDMIAFMEKIVSDASISKVALICDKVYAAKADEREGGVGTETQIISAEVYADIGQNKFAAVIAEKDADGKPYLPTYYKSRIYIDLSESDRYTDSFEKLVRWICDKPLFKKPELGKLPSYITDSDAPTLGTSALAKRAVDALKNGKANANGAVTEYLTTFADQLERFRITKGDGEFDELVIKSIEDFLPARNEFIQVLTTLANYATTESYSSALQRFYESLIPYMERPPHINQYNEEDYDNFRFIVHELFLYGVAILLKGEHFTITDNLLGRPYYVPDNPKNGNNAIVSFTALQQGVRILETRNQRLKLNRQSLHMDLLEQRSGMSGLNFRDLMQADFVCFLRGYRTHLDLWQRWRPTVLAHAIRQHAPFEIFARASSNAYLPSVLKVIGVSDKSELNERLESLSNVSVVGHSGLNAFSPKILAGKDQLGTRP